MLAEKIKQMADKYACGRLIFFLEGGYNLNTIGSSFIFTLTGLAG